MRRTLTILAATALAAAVAIPALAQSGGGSAPDPSLARFTACLHAHGVDAPAGLDGVGVKQWLAARQDQAPVREAMQACGTTGPDPGDQGFAALYSCLRSHGADVADTPAAVKREVVALSQTEAGRATLAACKVSVDKPADQGDAAPAKQPQVCGNKE